MNAHRFADELARLNLPPSTDDDPGGVGLIRFIAECPSGAEGVLLKVKEIIRIVDETCLFDWPTEVVWRKLLPPWFTLICIPTPTQTEAQQWLDQWRKLSPADQIQAEQEKGWSLDNWLYWMEAKNRCWFWWNASVTPEGNRILLIVEVDFWPIPWGALRWLFIAAGASSLALEE